MYCVALQGLCSVAILLLHLLICYHLLLLFVRGALLTPGLISGTFNCFLPLLNLSVIPSFVCLTRAGQQPVPWGWPGDISPKSIQKGTNNWLHSVHVCEWLLFWQCYWCVYGEHSVRDRGVMSCYSLTFYKYPGRKYLAFLWCLFWCFRALLQHIFSLQ